LHGHKPNIVTVSYYDLGGVIDRDYEGEIKVILFNHGDTRLHVKKGDRVAQIIIEQIASQKAIYRDEESGQTLKIHDILNTEVRGQRGFGSTGFK